jgi:hypothetical protein
MKESTKAYLTVTIIIVFALIGDYLFNQLFNF